MDDRDELFGGDFGFDDDDDDLGGDEFDFGDDDLDLDNIDDFDFDGDDNVIETDDEGGGPSRIFVILAALLIVVFIIGIAAIMLGGGGDELDPFDATATFIVQINATTEAEIQAQNTLDAQADLTQVAVQVTESVEQTEAALAAAAEQTSTARRDQIQQTQQAVNETSTAVAEAAQTLLDAEAAAEATANAQATALAESGQDEEGTPEPLAIPDVQLTGTALAQLYLELTPSVTEEVVSTVDVGTGGGDVGNTTGTTVTRPGQLPQTGFVDENLSLLVLAALGLMGVIFASRKLRTLNTEA